MQVEAAARVGYVVKRYPRYSETFIVNEILAHERAGFPVEIFALRPPVDTHFQDVIAQVRASVHYLPMPQKLSEFWSMIQWAERALPHFGPALTGLDQIDPRTLFQALHLAKWVKTSGMTHLHAHFATSATTVAMWAARFTEVPFSFTAHAKDIFHESVDPQDLRTKLEAADSVVTVSAYNLDFLQTNYGASAQRVRKLYNGLDLRAFPYHSPEERLPRIVAVGRLVEKKGFGELIEACAVLKNRGRLLACDIIGGGDLEAELQARIQAHGLGNEVTLTGPCPQHAVKQALGQAAVMAAPCVIGADGNRDGLPTVLLEAMALGTPCISTDVTGIPEVIRDQETGLQVPQHNPVALADALEDLCFNPQRRVRLALRARQLIESAFDIDINAAKLRAGFTGIHWEDPAAGRMRKPMMGVGA